MKRLRMALVCAAMLAAAMSASAQAKISGTVTCAKPDAVNAVPVGDRDGHAFVTMQQKCTWTKPLSINGVQAKTGADTLFSEVTAGKGKDNGYDVTSMANGDTFVVHFTGASESDKDGKLQTQSGTWTFVRGSGKLKGITGKGTYKGAGTPDGGSQTEVEGNFEITQ